MHKPLTVPGALAFALAIALTIYFFRRYSPGRAALYAMLIATLFLPEQVFVKLPLMPEFTKHRIATFAIMGCLLTLRRVRLPPVERWWYWLAAASFFVAIGTWRTNREVYESGSVTMQGLNFKDGMYLFLSELTGGMFAAYIGMRCFSRERDLRDWVRVLVGFGLFYSLLILFEVRMSPQLHTWVYGYPAFDDFGQSVRWGGYRPVVFMAHGLATSLFALGPTMMAAVLARFHQRVWNIDAGWVTLFLTVVVILCKSTGTWTYALVALPMARWASPKAMNRLAVVLAVIVCLYPWLRATDQFPVDWLLQQFGKISEERMLSLKFRFDNEDVLIRHAMEKPWFGWSVSYGRNSLFDEYGKMATTTDGAWIIALGNGGLLGLSVYLAIPVTAIFLTAKRSKRIRDPKLKVMFAALNLYLAIMWVDILPNGAFTLLPFFLAGALCTMSRILSHAPQPAEARRARPEQARVLSRPAPHPG